MVIIGAGISLLGIGHGLYIDNKGLVKMGIENMIWTTVLYLEYLLFSWIGRDNTDEEQDKTDSSS